MAEDINSRIERIQVSTIFTRLLYAEIYLNNYLPIHVETL